MPLDKKLIQKVREKHGHDKIILSLEEKGFCVSVQKDGQTLEFEARDVADFIPAISSASVSWVDYTADDLNKDAPGVASTLGFSEGLVSELLKMRHSSYEDHDSEMGLLIPAILVEGFNVTIDYLFILIRPGIVFTIHNTQVQRLFRLRRYAKIFMKKIKPTLSVQDKMTLILIRIIDENNTRNFDHLREVEANSDKLSEKLSSISTPREEIGADIHAMKHALITFLGGMWETVDALHALRYGDPELLTDDPKILQRVSALITEVNTHISLAEHMSDVLSSGLEVMQSIYNNQLQILNNKLAMLVAYLTIIGTAVLVPNTLATALSNPAFNMGPQDAWWYSALLLGSTIISTLAAYWWVKASGMLPEKAH